MSSPSVTCIVLNWNGWRDTLACLDALTHVDYPELSIIVVDNGSTNDSQARIQQAFPAIPFIQTGSNLGFAGGVNAGIRPALERGAQYIWLLNNDTVPRPDALSAMVAKATSDAGFGAIGSVLTYPESSRVQAWGGGRVNRWFGHSSHATTPHVDSWFHYITAASVLLSRQALEDVGLFDDHFFLYWEDTDLSMRLRARGWRLGVAQDSRVDHKENASLEGKRNAVDRFSTASGIRFLRKHSPAPLLAVPFFLLSRLGKRVLTGQFAKTRDVVGGVRDYLNSAARR